MKGVDRVSAAALSMPPSGGLPTTGHGHPDRHDLVDSYRRLADVFHHVLSEQALDTLLDRIADTLAELIPYDTLSIFEADEAQTELVPVLARDRWADEIMRNKIGFGVGIAGWAAQHREPVLTNAAHLDPRMMVVPGTPPDEREALITVPLIARDSVKGVLSIYRLGEHASFGSEEFGLVMGSCGTEDAVALANRLTERLKELEFGPAGKITVSVGAAEGPSDASNPRELIACAEAAMMTAKARGKDLIVLFDESTYERPDTTSVASSRVRSIAHLKMLQSLAGKLNRLNDVRQIGTTIADELRGLIEYHNCRVSIVDGDEIIPIAFRGVLSSRGGHEVQIPRSKIGEGITGHAAADGKSLLIGNALDCDYAVTDRKSTRLNSSHQIRS